MGFFSWNTCDSGISIPAAASGRPMKPVYLLQPGGLPPVKEECYEGRGRFGVVNAYVWLAKANAETLGIELSGCDDDEIAQIGIQMELGHVYKDVNSGELWHVFHDSRALIEGRYFKGNFAEIIPEFGKSANQLVGDGRLRELAVSKVIGLQYPLKFSFNPDAVYEDHLGSDTCCYQGYFYEDGAEGEI